MTRASLLHVLDPGTTLGLAEVRELEQLAQAFPYCQTAHLLLAKAAHDQGAMLAGQRLRRAATYAADRALLRRLIESVTPAAAVAEPLPGPTPEVAAAATPEVVAPQPARFVVQRPAAENTVVELEAEAFAPATPVSEKDVATGFEGTLSPSEQDNAGLTPELPAATPAPLAAAMPLGAVGTEQAPASSPLAAAPAVAPKTGVLASVAGASWAVSSTASAGSGGMPVSILGEVMPSVPADFGLPVLNLSPEVLGTEGLEITDSIALEDDGNTVSQVADVAPGTAGLVSVEEISADAAPVKELVSEPVPAAAAPTVGDVASASIPGAAVSASGEPTAPAESLEITNEPQAETQNQPLAETLKTASPVRVVRPAVPEAPLALASVEALPQTSAPAAAELPAVAPPVRPPAEAAVARLEYGLAEELEPTPAYLLPGLSDEWTWTLPPKPFVQPVLTPAAFLGDETVGYGWGESTRLGLALMPLATTEQPDNAEPVAFALPLPNDFFAPDALLQQHWAEHQPKALPPPTSLELIETFLRQKPRLTRPALAKTSSEAITDLAAPSTNAPPELVSESLARILARQGKLARAIEVYERLMVKHPEKMAYFATEIQSLQLQQPPLP